MTDFVLVHGTWGGGWQWRPVAERLRAARPSRVHADPHRPRRARPSGHARDRPRHPHRRHRQRDRLGGAARRCAGRHQLWRPRHRRGRRPHARSASARSSSSTPRCRRRASACSTWCRRSGAPRSSGSPARRAAATSCRPRWCSTPALRTGGAHRLSRPHEPAPAALAATAGAAHRPLARRAEQGLRARLAQADAPFRRVSTNGRATRPAGRRARSRRTIFR